MSPPEIVCLENLLPEEYPRSHSMPFFSQICLSQLFGIELLLPQQSVKKAMQVKAMLVTHHLPEESMPWMAEVRRVFDELVIFIDEKRVTPGTLNRAKKVGSRVHLHKAETWFDWDLASKARACESDWVFVIEYDEQLSPEWQQKDQWRQILETTAFTHFWFPRRWIVPGERRFIKCDPWWPDFQLRLVRNNLKGTKFATKLHEVIRVSGAGAYFQNLAIHHHVLWLWSRAKRVERVRYYEQLQPGFGQGYTYLYEDYSPPEAPLPKPKKLNIQTELARMEKLRPEEMLKLSFKLQGVPEAVRTSEVLWLDGEVTNPTSRTLSSCHPSLGVHLAYHWLDRATRRMVIWDGCRTRLFPGASAGMATRCTMMIAAPDQPGEYLLQTSMVQEGVCWFEKFRPEILQEFPVLVTDRIGSQRGVALG